MSITFLLAKQLTPKIVTYLQKAVDKTPYGIYSLQDYLLLWQHNQALIYYSDKCAAYIKLIQGKDTTFMNLVLLGGEDIHEWKQDFAKFIKNMAKVTNTTFIFNGRLGWGKIFKEDLKQICGVYTLNDL